MSYMNNINQLQKYVLYTSAMALLVAVFLHNPTQGYSITKTLDELKGSSDQTGENCREEIHILFRGYSNVNVCDYVIPFKEWSSSAAIVSWFGPLINIIWLFIITIAITGLLVHATASKPKQQE